MRRLLVLLSFALLPLALALAVGASGASHAVAATSGAKGTFCGASRCVALPPALAVTLSQRNESFSSAPTPKRTPFYRITIKASGEGFINRTIIWVPSARVWYLKEYVTPPNPGYWRSENPATTAALNRLATKIKPFPAPAHWMLPH